MSSFPDDSFICFKFANSPHKIILSKDFIKEKMNHIFCKLIGVTDDDEELTTISPSKDENSIYTILQDLYVSYEDFKYLVLFLRTGNLNDQYINNAMNAAISLGGFPELDSYAYKCFNTPLPVPPQKEPIEPIEDTDNKYDWTIVRTQEYSYSTDAAIDYVKDGWSFTGGIASNDNKNAPLMYMRKLRET